ncbi:MAG: DNA translocase FtsK 4TM domain-containing protein [Bacteroidota bacterium]
MANKGNPLRANTFKGKDSEEELIVNDQVKREEQKEGAAKAAKPEKTVRPRKAKKQPENSEKKKRDFRVFGLFLLVLGLFLSLAFSSFLMTWQEDFTFANKVFTDFNWRFLFKAADPVENVTGKIGALLSYLILYSGVGVSAFFIALFLLIAGTRLLFQVTLFPLGKTFKFALCGMIWLPVALGLFFPGEMILFGIYGYQSNLILTDFLGETGLIFLLAFTLLTFLILTFNIPFRWFKKKVQPEVKEELPSPVAQSVDPTTTTEKDWTNEPELAGNRFFDEGQEELLIEPESPVERVFEDVTPQVKEVSDTVEFQIETPVEQAEPVPENTELTEHYTLDTKFDPTLELRGYKFPPLDLLNDYGNDASTININNEELSANKNRIVETLNNYSIKIQKIKATIGPTVTLYEIVPEAGVRISKIKNLENDIALSLAALGIRIIAPIPGKGTIGIEVPNQNPEIVSIKSLLGSDKFQKSSFELPFVLGKTIANETFIADLTKMPHILMAGATGQGKSVGLNTIITSLLYKKHPSLVKFVMIDPKKVELSLFSKIERHYLAKLPDSEDAIITDTKKVIRTLNSLNIEMDSRYDLLQDAQVRNIREYNEKFISRRLNPNDNHRFLPYIIVFVDEFADLIMTAGREIETPITRLAQLARAVGIHLVIATQRPSVNIITGTIKANFPVRIAFKVASKIDSRTILDQSGADQLIGRGDMLLSLGSDLIRLQCAFVDTPEIEKVTDFIGSQRGFPEVYNLPEVFDEESESVKEFDPHQRDELFADAARMIVQHQQGSTSLLQRKLKLGYNRAGRIIDQLESAGIVGPFEGSKAREVRYKDSNALEQYLKDLGEF